MKGTKKYKSYTTQNPRKAPRIAPQRVTFALLLALLGLSGVATFVLASDVSDAGYRGRITISNNSSDATNIIAAYDLNTQSLINTNKLGSSANDCAMQVAAGTDTAFMPSVNSSFPWVTWVSAIGEDETLYQYLYTFGVTGGKLRYFPDTGGMTTPDSPSLEPSANFTFEQSGWVDTSYSANKTLIDKPNAFSTFISGAGEITSSIYDSGIMDSYEGSADLDIEFYTTTWHAMTFTPPVDVAVTSISVYTKKIGNPGTVTISLRATSAGLPTGADLEDGTTNGNAWATSYAWNIITLDSPYELTNGVQYAAVIRIAGDGSNKLNWGMDNTAQSYAGGNDCRSTNSGGSWADYGSPAYDALFRITGEAVVSSVTATSVSSGEHTIKTTANITHLWLDIDGSTENTTALGGESIPDNSSNWTYYENMGGYWEYTDISVNGTQVQYIDWEYSTTFNDTSGYDNDAIPTFRTTSSDADVSANLSSLVGIMETSPPPAAGQTGWDILPSVPSPPTGFFTEFDPSSMTFWGSGYIAEFHTNTGIPLALIVFPYAFGIAIGLGFLAWYISSGGGKNKHGRGSLLAMAITTLIVMIYFVYGAGGVIPGWILVPFGIEVLAFIVWRQTPSPF